MVSQTLSQRTALTHPSFSCQGPHQLAHGRSEQPLVGTRVRGIEEFYACFRRSRVTRGSHRFCSYVLRQVKLTDPRLETSGQVVNIGRIQIPFGNNRILPFSIATSLPDNIQTSLVDSSEGNHLLFQLGDVQYPFQGIISGILVRECEVKFATSENGDLLIRSGADSQILAKAVIIHASTGVAHISCST